MFFPDKNDYASRNEAIVVCFSCPVLKQCKEYRERTDSKYGIWAGKNHKPSDRT